MTKEYNAAKGTYKTSEIKEQSLYFTQQTQYQWKY